MESTSLETEGLTTGQRQAEKNENSTRNFSLYLLATLLSGIFLGSASTYYFTTRSATIASNDKSTLLAKDFTSSINFLVVGDWGREGNFNQSVVATSMGSIARATEVEFIISTGDNFYETGLSSENDPLFNASFSDIYIHKSLQVPWYVVLGNHDYAGNPLVQTGSKLREKDHRWNCGRHFVVKKSLCRPTNAKCSASMDLFFIDTSPFLTKYWQFLNFSSLSTQSEEINASLSFLRTSLQASSATWHLVIGHHPIRSMGAHGDTEELIRYLLPLLEEFKVDAYVNGHDHALELIQRQDSPIPLLTSGAGSKCYRPRKNETQESGLKFWHSGQGFLSASVAPSLLRFVYYDLFGEPLHTFDLSK